MAKGRIEPTALALLEHWPAELVGSPGFHPVTWASLSMKPFLSGAREIAGISQMTPPPPGSVQGGISLLFPSQGAPSVAIPMETVTGTQWGDNRGVRRENHQQLRVCGKEQGKRSGGREWKEKRGEGKERQRGERGGGEREREERVFSLEKNGNLIRSVFIVQIENQF